MRLFLNWINRKVSIKSKVSDAISLIFVTHLGDDIIRIPKSDFGDPRVDRFLRTIAAIVRTTPRLGVMMA